jgi:hypothetical protein
MKLERSSRLRDFTRKTASEGYCNEAISQAGKSRTRRATVCHHRNGRSYPASRLGIGNTLRHLLSFFNLDVPRTQSPILKSEDGEKTNLVIIS